MTPDPIPIDLKARCNAIEECYEFMLAYAAQGVVNEAGSQSASELRTFLGRAEAALVDLASRVGWSFLVHHTDRSPAEPLLTLIMRLGAGGYRWQGTAPSQPTADGERS